MRRKDMKEYKKAGLHQAELYRDARMVEWGVYKCKMRRARGQEGRAGRGRRMQNMWNEWGALWGHQRRKRGAGGERRRSKRGWCWTEERGTRPERLCAPLELKEARGKVQSATGQWYDVHADMFRRDNIPEGAGQGDQYWRCTKEAGQVPWPVLRMTAWAFPTATMRTTDARGAVMGDGTAAAQGGAGG